MQENNIKKKIGTCASPESLTSKSAATIKENPKPLPNKRR
jgi:hypothetical protein